MPIRKCQDMTLQSKRRRDDVKVLAHLMNRRTLKGAATGRLESPQKLVIYYAGYVAMRRILETKSENGTPKTGDEELDLKSDDPHSLIYRIDKEVAHPLGCQTSTLFRVAKFKYWGSKVLAACLK